MEHYKNSSTLKDAIRELTDVDGTYTDIEFQIEEKLKVSINLKQMSGQRLVKHLTM